MTKISNNSNSSRLVYLQDFIEVHMLKNFLEELSCKQKSSVINTNYS